MFIAEAEGLKRIRQTNTIKVPEVICYGSSADEQFLVLEWIENGIVSDVSQENLGRGLAQLHKSTQLQFGLDHNNYMGSLAQLNNRHYSWNQFFIEQRLKPQVELGKKNGLLAGRFRQCAVLLQSSNALIGVSNWKSVFTLLLQ